MTEIRAIPPHRYEPDLTDPRHSFTIRCPIAIDTFYGCIYRLVDGQQPDVLYEDRGEFGRGPLQFPLIQGEGMLFQIFGCENNEIVAGLAGSLIDLVGLQELELIPVELEL